MPGITRAHALLHRVMVRRAERLARSMLPHLPAQGSLLDIGSGTGHTVQALRQRSSLELHEVDVVDMHVVGSGPVLFDGTTLPFSDGRFNAACLLFLMQYCSEPTRLLREAARVSQGPILVAQSTWDGAIDYAALKVNELIWGHMGLTVAQWMGWVRPCDSPLAPQLLYSGAALVALFQSAGLIVRDQIPLTFGFLPIHQNLYILERAC